MLAGWRWDVALLQEVPPWWTADLAAACAARGAAVLTSRNSALPLRHALAERWPDAIKSNGGGANVILLRDTSERLRSSHVRLRVWPERRVAQAVWLPDGSVAVNYHGSARVPLATQELERLWGWAVGLAGGAPVVLGGDLNLREPAAPPGAVHAARRDVDHIFAAGYEVAGAAGPLARTLDLGGREVELSDHPPLLAQLVRSAVSAGE